MIAITCAVEALAADGKTEVMLLVAKPPAPAVQEKLGRLLRRVGKPAVIVFLGGQAGTAKGKNVYEAGTLEEGALLAVALWRAEPVEKVRERLAGRAVELKERARAIVGNLQPTQKYVRALYTGGTFCSEAQVICRGRLPGLHSNVPLPGVAKLASSLQSERHTFLDLGEDEFTAGRLHPMIDFSMRRRRMLQEAGDPQTALLLLDLVLGYGANRDPLPEIIPALRACRDAAGGRHLPMIFSVTGTERDPQQRSRVVAGLQENGAEVLEANAAAGRLALFVAEFQGRRP